MLLDNLFLTGVAKIAKRLLSKLLTDVNLGSCDNYYSITSGISNKG